LARLSGCFRALPFAEQQPAQDAQVIQDSTSRGKVMLELMEFVINKAQRIHTPPSALVSGHGHIFRKARFDQFYLRRKQAYILMRAFDAVEGRFRLPFFGRLITRHCISAHGKSQTNVDSSQILRNDAVLRISRQRTTHKIVKTPREFVD
jgi:hypothetical protein